MPSAPDLATIAGLIGERARAEMLLCLMAGRSFTATELARVARVTKQTASSHLAKLTVGRLVAVERRGRHRYFRLANHDVGAVLEALLGVAQRAGTTRIDPGPPDPALRKARVCYDHLAGELAVLVLDSLKQQGLLRQETGGLRITEAGRRFCQGFGIELTALENRRRPLCLPCLDWSARRDHLAGALGAALLSRCFALNWARRLKASRTVSFSAWGERALRTRFPLRG